MTYKIKEITEEDYGCEGVPGAANSCAACLWTARTAKNGCVSPIDCCAKTRSMSAAMLTRRLCAS